MIVRALKPGEQPIETFALNTTEGIHLLRQRGYLISMIASFRYPTKELHEDALKRLEAIEKRLEALAG